MTSAPRTDAGSTVQTPIRRQEVVAELGQRALETEDLDELLRVVAAAVVETLDSDAAAIFEALPEDDLVLRADEGRRDERLDPVVPADSDSLVGDALRSDEPVVVDDPRNEPRDADAASAPRPDCDAVSAASVRIGPREDPWGALRTHATERREFTARDAAFVRDVGAILESAIENVRTRRSLREEKDQFRQLVAEVEDYAIFMLDSAGYVRSWNAGAEQIKGYAADEIVGEHVSTFYPDEALENDRPARLLSNAASTGRTEDEGWRVRKDGSRFWASVSITALYDDDGSLQGFTKITRDLTERREREQQLELFRTLLDQCNDSVLVIEPHTGRFLDANETACRRLGYDHDELVGLSVPDIERIFDDREDWRSHVETVKSEGTVTVEGEHRRKDGTTHPAEVNVTYVELDRDYMIAVARDVTERKETERQLRERERALEQYREYTNDVLDAIDDVFYVIDEDGTLRRWNESAVDVTGYDRGEIESMDVREFFEPADRDAISNAVEEGLETGRTRVEAAIRTKSGERIPYEFVAAGLETPTGERVLAGIGRDITVRKEHERRLRESNERLEQFAYAASHDLQEPLRMVSSYLQLIDRRYGDALDEDGAEFLEYAVDGAERMREMIDGLLEYSRIETQGDPFEPVDLDAVLEDVRDDLRLQIDETDAEISIEPLPTVEGDPSQLRQVFQNLLSNAIAYSGDARPRVRIDAERRGRMWSISVRDDGVGIDPGEQDRIFEVFQRLHGREEHDGTGIGLALCQRIVERHGGTIRVDSEPGEGSTFSVALPAADP